MLIASRSARPRGFTLAELMVAVVLLGVVTVTVTVVAARQQRLFRGTLRALEQHGQLRQGAGVVEGVLRGLSPESGDILALSDTALEVVAAIGSAVVCAAAAADPADAIHVPAPDTARGALAAWLDAPRAGDSLWLHDERDPDVADDDTVLGYRVAEAAPRADACVGAGGGWRLTVDSGGAPARPGAPVRLLRRLRLSFYRSPADGQWYLGLREWVGGVPQAVQPVSGPYRRGAGLTFRYADGDGVAVRELAHAASVARIDLVLRAPDDESSSSAAPVRADSLVVRIALRNRRRGGAPGDSP